LAEIVSEQDVFGRNGRIRLELEHPVPVALLMAMQRARCTCNAGLQGLRRRRCGSSGACDVLHQPALMMCSAALSPEPIDPSMVDGSPVAVQSPARNRFFHSVTVPGRSASCSGVAA